MSDPVPDVPEPTPDDEFWYLDDEDDDSPADDEDLFGFQGWTRGGTPIQEF